MVKIEIDETEIVETEEEKIEEEMKKLLDKESEPC